MLESSVPVLILNYCNFTSLGRGRQVIAVARTADVVLMMLDATKGDVQRQLLEAELESVGIRLNKPKPNIYFKVRISMGQTRFYGSKHCIYGFNASVED